MEITATKIFKEYGFDVVFDDVSFTIAQGEKVGLVGFNGTGKTTLLKILAGEVQVDAGTVKMPKGAIVGYVPQDTYITTTETVIEYIHTTVQKARGDEYEIEKHTIEALLDGFGIRDLSLDTPLQQLSSGQKTKVFLTAVLLLDPDILLLDEPTNNLDLTALVWLEGFLKKTKASCVIISHDRVFLDNVVNTIFDIDWHTRRLTISHGRYSAYIQRRKEENALQEKDYTLQKNEIKRTEAVAEMYIEREKKGAVFETKDNDKLVRGYNRDRSVKSGRAAKALMQRIEHMDIKERPVERRGLVIDISSQKKGGVKDIELFNVVVGHEKGMRAGPVSLRIGFGDRVVLLGDNGVGKSTLLKTILGTIKPVDGEVRFGSSIVVGNFTQEHDNLPKDKTPRAFFEEHTDLKTNEIYNIMRKHGFTESEVDKEIGSFSPGGRARILFALFSAQSVNALFLDEPTNHLDIEAVDALEEIIQSYAGTIVLVSHDRHLLDIVRPTNVLLVSSDGTIKQQADIGEYIATAEKRAERLGYII